MSLDTSMPLEFRPVFLSRRGEATAWILTLITLLTLMVVRTRSQGWPVGSIFFFVFLLLSALSISLSNWMDRRTRIRVDAEGISFGNGLRKIHLLWGEIKRVQVEPSRLGDKVYVMGEQADFRFRMLGDVKFRGQVKGQLGFVHGEALLQLILKHSGLLALDGEGSRRYDASR